MCTQFNRKKKLNIAQNFNNFFTSIGKKLQNKIYPTNRDYSHYLISPNPNTFFTSPTSPEEVINIIQNLKTSKRTGPNSLPQKIIKQIKKTVTPTFRMNKSFAQGISHLL